MSLEAKNSKAELGFAHFVVGLCLTAWIVLIGIMVVTSQGFMSLETGLLFLTLGYGPDVAIWLFGLSILSLLISLFRNPMRMGWWALTALCLSGLMVLSFYGYQKAIKFFPPINQVSTDWERPIILSDKLLDIRGKSAPIADDDDYIPSQMSLSWGGRRVAEINSTTCPVAQGLPIRNLTHKDLVQIIKELGLTIITSDSERIEAVRLSHYYGVKSDLIVRIGPDKIDLRAISRQSIPDLGSNCRLIGRVIKEVRARQGT
jgi:fatty-acyl-CoA synthase